MCDLVSTSPKPKFDQSSEAVAHPIVAAAAVEERLRSIEPIRKEKGSGGTDRSASWLLLEGGQPRGGTASLPHQLAAVVPSARLRVRFLPRPLLIFEDGLIKGEERRQCVDEGCCCGEGDLPAIDEKKGKSKVRP